MSKKGAKAEGKITRGFFAVDVRSVHYACQHGINTGTAYIVMAAGTGDGGVALAPGGSDHPILAAQGIERLSG
jgi:hypothetical protein